MRIVTVSLTALALAFGAGAVWSGPPGGCPPGLAKKSPACVPPGQARKMNRQDIETHDRWDPENGYYRHGRVVDAHFVLIEAPWRYGLDGPGQYYRRDGYILRVDPETREILDLIGAIGALLD